MRIDSFDEVSLQVYPNPAKDRLYIYPVHDTGWISFTDMQGCVSVQKCFNGNIDVSFLNQGIYIISLGNKHIKFVKE